MPNFAVIENEKVINVVVAEADYAAEQGWIELVDDAGIGCIYIDGQFVDKSKIPQSIL
jgi:hypothetical protein